MESFVDILIWILAFIAIVIIVYLIFTAKTKDEIDYEERIKKSLGEEYIIDPESGAKLTLEQAESGHWIAHDNEFRTIPQSDIDKLPTESHVILQKALNYLIESRQYLRSEFSEEQINILDQSKLLGRYDNWVYSDSFKFNNGYVFLPAPTIYGGTFERPDYRESQLMFWQKIENIEGHYVFRPKSAPEKFFDLIRRDDDIKLEDYECFTIAKTKNIILINNLVKKIVVEKNLEIEVHDYNLFLKTTKLANLVDIKRIESIIEKIN